MKKSCIHPVFNEEKDWFTPDPLAPEITTRLSDGGVSSLSGSLIFLSALISLLQCIHPYVHSIPLLTSENSSFSQTMWMIVRSDQQFWQGIVCARIDHPDEWIHYLDDHTLDELVEVRCRASNQVYSIHSDFIRSHLDEGNLCGFIHQIVVTQYPWDSILTKCMVVEKSSSMLPLRHL